MDVKVYLNEGADMFTPFNAETAELRLAAEFELEDLEVGSSFEGHKIEAAVYAALEVVFKQLNVGGDLLVATTWTEKYRADGNRSLSVGDVVTIGESAYAVGRFGWDKVSGADLAAAIAAR